jgi:hypothetical protein
VFRGTCVIEDIENLHEEVELNESGLEFEIACRPVKTNPKRPLKRERDGL